MVSSILAWENKWRSMARELPTGSVVPPLWKGAALMELCPDDVQDQVYLHIEEIRRVGHKQLEGNSVAAETEEQDDHECTEHNISSLWLVGSLDVMDKEG